jgi:hypothetical protein
MEINGLPAHVLLVHVVVVMLPLASALAVLGSVWPAAQRKFTFLTPLAALAGLVAVPLTINAGADLAAQLQIGAAIAQHEALGRRVLPLAAVLFVTTAGQWAYFAFVKRKRWLTILIAVLVILSAAATTAQVALAGDAGAQMVWGSIG